MSFFNRIILLGLCFWLSPAWSISNSWLAATASSQHASVMVSAKKGINDQVQMLIDVELMDGWKTYWSSPGEGGVAPEIKWLTPVDNVDWNWPVPQRFHVSGLTVQGYQDKVVFPITFTANKPQLEGILTLSTCSDICVLTDIPFTVDLTQPAVENFDYEFIRALASVPLKTGMINEATATYADGQLVIEAQQSQNWQNPDLFFNIPDGVNFSDPKIEYQGTALRAEISVSGSWGAKTPERVGENLAIVISDANMAQELVLSIQKGQLSQTNEQQNIWVIAVFALLGGFILNLMPCVLPVLGMKLSSILRFEQREKRAIRKQFLLSASGIMASFIFLAMLMTILRISQHAVGWGIQFQNVWFISFMVIVTAIFSANLLDLISINLPSRFSTRLATTGGHFWEGAFATLLATPCSAPFLGTAVAYALVAPYSHLWLIFILLAIGMSLPWLLIAAIPQIALWLPKPGNWMNILRLVMGGLMLATSFWLLTLLIVHIGWQAFLITIAGICILLLILIKRRYSNKTLLISFIGLSLIVAISFGIGQLTQNTPSQGDNIKWQPLSEQAIIDALQDNKKVFVEITADWCITCKVNKFNVLMDAEVQQRLAQDDIITLRGDWTVPSESVTEFLKKRGALAVPFNQVYSISEPDGVILPTLLDKDVLLDLLNEVNNKTAEEHHDD